ncbi:MAG TPA: sigma 54-interacting transcriptional regulator [Chloroflexota bacterium]|nr:sigma 54-interacting transcriptional regulator [Chloroflexota bacterium]
MTQRPRTIGELRESGYQPQPIKEEMRKNLIAKMRAGDELFPGIVGYEETVIPQVENAILSGQDIVLLGERGQAKTRIARSLVNLLDPDLPVIAGCEINDNPFAPVCAACRQKVAEHGDIVEIAWLPREARYGEKLATPDITIADLIGEIDPIKVAEGRYLSDELTIAYGLVPRTNRGIFCLNELPDLAERIQVGLLNIMEERDVQIRGYKIRLPLDVYVVASANPEDYTNRGRIITPLKDRIGSEIRTHYPRTIEHEITIMEQEAVPAYTDGMDVFYPRYMKEIIAEITHLARKHSDISKRSGVSVRVSISNYENVLSNALRRAIRLSEKQVAPRISDLPAVIASTAGKIELETVGDTTEERIIERLIQGAVVNVFNRNFLLQEFDELLANFERGFGVDTSDGMPVMQYVQQVSEVRGMRGSVAKLNAERNPASAAAAVEFILEGLHLNRKLNKDRRPGSVRYRK